MRAELAAMWNQSNRPRSFRRITSATSVLVPFSDNIILQNQAERFNATDDNEIPLKVILRTNLHRLRYMSISDSYLNESSNS